MLAGWLPWRHDVITGQVDDNNDVADDADEMKSRTEWFRRQINCETIGGDAANSTYRRHDAAAVLPADWQPMDEQYRMTQWAVSTKKRFLVFTIMQGRIDHRWKGAANPGPKLI